jgi:sugar/nucleoside kinase (ribokinase family)
LNEFADSDDLPQSLRAVDNWGAGAVVLHLGAKGAGYYHHGHLTVEESVPAKQQVNTTGTGDVLSACMMLLAQESGSTVSEKLRLANLIVSQFIAGERALSPAL